MTDHVRRRSTILPTTLTLSPCTLWTWCYRRCRLMEIFLPERRALYHALIAAGRGNHILDSASIVGYFPGK